MCKFCWKIKLNRKTEKLVKQTYCDEVKAEGFDPKKLAFFFILQLLLRNLNFIFVKSYEF